MAGSDVIGGTAANGEIEVGILQADLELSEQRPQDAGEIGDFSSGYFTEGLHVAQREDASSEGCGRSKDLPRPEVARLRTIRV